MVDEGLFKLIPEDPETQQKPWQSIAERFKQSIEETLKTFEPMKQDEYEGKSLAPIKTFERPLIKDFVDPHYKESYGAPPSISKDEMKRIAELKGDVIKGSVDCYSAEKLEKITLVHLQLVQRYYGIIMNIWPADSYAFPILTLTIDESPNYTHFFVDFIPLADYVVDTSYLERYLDPLEPVWRTYKFIRDLPNFPTFEVNLYSWMRALRSPYLITRRVPPNKPKGIREDLIRLGLDYLKVYIDLWEKAEPQDKTYMNALNTRKAKIRAHFRTGKDPDGKFWWKGERYLGKELTHLLVNTCY
jgi:hypothetical protein